jgi:hypothetical protein
MMFRNLDSSRNRFIEVGLEILTVPEVGSSRKMMDGK